LATRKTYPNSHEEAFAQLAEGLGWRVAKRGWPDFFCYDPDTEGMIFVEVKPPGQKLRAHQWLVMRGLDRLGAKCFVSDGVKLEPFDSKRPFEELVESADSPSDWLI